jgi:inner membrane protein
MLFRSHVVFGLFLFFVLVNYIESSKWLFLFGVLLGSILVDIDSKNSKVGNYFLLRPLQFFIKHRGIIHSLAFGFVVMILFGVFNVDLAFGFMIGFLGHLLLDSLTRQKIMPFWPLFRTKIGFGIIRTGGLIETIFFVLLLLLDIFLFFYVLF